jgi:hypothetical protein
LLFGDQSAESLHTGLSTVPFTSSFHV